MVDLPVFVECTDDAQVGVYCARGVTTLALVIPGWSNAAQARMSEATAGNLAHQIMSMMRSALAGEEDRFSIECYSGVRLICTSNLIPEREWSVCISLFEYGTDGGSVVVELENAERLAATLLRGSSSRPSTEVADN